MRGPGPPSAPVEPLPDSRRQPRRRLVCQRSGRGAATPRTAPHRGRTPGRRRALSARAARGPLRVPAPRGSPGDRSRPVSDRSEQPALGQTLGAWQICLTASWAGWDPHLTDGHPIYALVGVELFPDLGGRLVRGKSSLCTRGHPLSFLTVESPFPRRLSPKCKADKSSKCAFPHP